MKDRSPTTRSTGPPIELGGQVADVGAVVHPHPLVGLQRPGELPVADVDRDHLAAPARSSTSVNPPVDAPASRQRRPATLQPERLEGGQRAGQLVSAARHVVRAVGIVAHTIAASVVTPVAGLVATSARHLHPPVCDQLARMLTRAGEPAPYQLGVEAQATRWHRLRRTVRCRRPRARSAAARGRPRRPAPARTARRRGRREPTARRPARAGRLDRVARSRLEPAPTRTGAGAGWLGASSSKSTRLGDSSLMKSFAHRAHVVVAGAASPRYPAASAHRRRPAAPCRRGAAQAATATTRHQSSSCPPPSTVSPPVDDLCAPAARVRAVRQGTACAAAEPAQVGGQVRRPQASAGSRPAPAGP